MENVLNVSHPTTDGLTENRNVSNVFLMVCNFGIPILRPANVTLTEPPTATMTAFASHVIVPDSGIVSKRDAIVLRNINGVQLGNVVSAALLTSLIEEVFAQTAQALNSGTQNSQPVSAPHHTLTTSRMKTPATAAPCKKETGTTINAINVLKQSLTFIMANAINVLKALLISGPLMENATSALIQILMRL